MSICQPYKLQGERTCLASLYLWKRLSVLRVFSPFAELFLIYLRFAWWYLNIRHIRLSPKSFVFFTILGAFCEWRRDGWLPKISSQNLLTWRHAFPRGNYNYGKKMRTQNEEINIRTLVPTREACYVNFPADEISPASCYYHGNCSDIFSSISADLSNSDTQYVDYRVEPLSFLSYSAGK